MKLENNNLDDLIELRKYLIENKFPQSFIDLIENYIVNNLLTIEELVDIVKR